uniref:Larval cement protein 2 n=1 Tax=Megabalanus rosa TaxID=6680 RepID=A0A8D5M2T4_MEGRO|nr:larval cement protein 2 [Megabalanus rosa]
MAWCAAAALWLLIGLQLADGGVRAATLVGRGIHPKTRCCKKTGAIEPLKGITTLDACEAYCKRLNLQSIKLGPSSFACKRPKYACDQTSTGAGCAACYKAGTCFLMPFVGGIRVSTRTDISKRRLAEQEKRERVFKEKGEGTRHTGLGGVSSITGQKTGKKTEDERKAAEILTKSVTTSLNTENFGGFAKNGPVGAAEFLSGAGELGSFAGKIGRNGAIQQTKQVQLAKRKRLKNTSGQVTNRQQENFVQDLGMLGPGQKGSFSSKGTKKELRSERARRAETERAKTESKKLSLSGTAAHAFKGSGGGPVELLEQKQNVIGTESELREGTVISGGTTKENLRLAGRGGDLEIASLERRSTGKAKTQTAIKGRSLAKAKLRQAATDQGLNQDLQTDVLGQRQTNTATRQSGSFVQLEKKGKKCDHCTSTLKKLTKGTTFGSSRERLQEQTRQKKRDTLRGRAGQGATLVSTGKETNRFRRAKQSGSGSDVQEKYKGANSHLSTTGSVRGKVSGSAATRTRKRSYETEEGLSSQDVKELNILGFPTTTKG